MKHYLLFRLPVLRTSILMLLLMPMQARAEGQIDLKPYVAASLTYDDNLFRLAGQDQARIVLGSDAMSDRVTRTEAGINVDWKISRQHLRLELNLNQNRYDRFGFLDNDGSNKKIAWDWSVGNHLNGELSMTEGISMGGFSEIHNPVLNQQTNTLRLMSLNWDFHPSWRLHLQHDETDFLNSLASYKSSDRNDVAQELALQYSTPGGNHIGLSARETKTEYPGRDSFSTVVFGNSNRQRDLALNVMWQPAGKTRIDGRLALVERKYDELKQRDVTDWAGRVSLDWQATGKTALQATVEHTISPIEDKAATYVQTDRVTLSPAWTATEKISVQGSLAYESSSYLGDPGFVLGGAPLREDKVKTVGLVVSYKPYDKVQTQLSVQKSKRDSSVAANSYETNSINVNVRFDF